MFEDSNTWLWGLGIILFAFGMAAGFLIGFLFLPRDSQRVQALEKELAETREALEAYRGRVNEHFQQTAELFEDMTERYRAVYRHLATSAAELCPEAPPALSFDAPARERLVADAAETPAPEGETAESDATTGTAAAGDAPQAAAGEEALGDAPHVPEVEPGTTAAGQAAEDKRLH